MKTGKVTIVDDVTLLRTPITHTEFTDSLQTEIDVLQEKVTLLEAFLGSPDFQSLGLVSQTLLEVQLNIMDAYSNILAARIRAAGGL